MGQSVLGMIRSAIHGAAGLGLVLAVGLAVPVRAHPHVWIDARAEVLFDGVAVVGIRHHWQFDEYFSAWAVQGLDANGDGIFSPSELQPLANENIVGLDYYSYYTFAGPEGGDNFGFDGAVDPSMVFEDGRATLTFTALFDRPYPVDGTLDIEVGDPEYYSAITFDGEDAVRLENAPEGCTVTAHAPQPIDPAIEERLWLLGPEVTELPPDLREAARALANLAVVACPPVAATTALAATQQMAAVRPTPFVAPPVEPNFGGGAQTGIFGWIAEQQRSFYLALTSALSDLHEDWRAFWVLGVLSFLYGVFHAAGPGHGKVVISSYVVANERQVRRGVVLSFLSAMLQAGVAVGFVLIAAGLLRLTSIAMSSAANWISLASYALVALLGAYLAARKLLGFGHSHAHDDHAHFDHSPNHDHHHHHAVLPQETEGNWRESLGVVLAVGLRPCSGALVVLVFALSQGLLPAGIFATVLMGLGTALTVALIAAFAVVFKGAALRLGGGGAVVASLLWWVELAAALLVMALGLMLLFASL